MNLPRGAHGVSACVLAALSQCWASGCSRQEEKATEAETSVSSTPARASATAPTPASSLSLLYLPDADDRLPPPVGGGLLPTAPYQPLGRCPAEMVDVRGQFCVDRFEITLVDVSSGDALSPHYPPIRAAAVTSFDKYRQKPARNARELRIPELPAFQRSAEFEPRARSVLGVLPQGYLNLHVAERACRAAGKRLCSHAEWVTACRGEQNRKFPYGDAYREGACNVFRESHPAAELWGDASREHLDPRLGLVAGARGPLLRSTGATPSCRSTWGADGAFDMVGNQDEWVSDGFFVGGFYARGTREGCDARISSHAPEYFDYSLGTRCCK